MTEHGRWVLALCIWLGIAVVVFGALGLRRLWRTLYDTDVDRAERGPKDW